MMTQREARLRCEVNNMHIRFDRGEARVSFPELANNSVRSEATAYYTDDLEDAVLTAGAMRRRLGGKLAS